MKKPEFDFEVENEIVFFTIAFIFIILVGCVGLNLFVNSTQKSEVKADKPVFETVEVKEIEKPKSGINLTPSERSEIEPKYIIDTYEVSAYCSCVKCCGKTDGITKSGKKAQANHTIAVDPIVILLGTKVIIDNTEFTAEDTGGAIKGKRIDVFFLDHNSALAHGRQTKEVKILK